MFYVCEQRLFFKQNLSVKLLESLSQVNRICLSKQHQESYIDFQGKVLKSASDDCKSSAR